MAENKRYFWLRLKDDFFEQKLIKKIRKIAGGDTYVIIYLKMQLLGIKTEGILKFEGFEDDFAEELALELDEDVENVKVTVSYLQRYNVIEILENNDFFMPGVIELTGSESKVAERVRRCRNNKIELEGVTPLLQCNTDETPCNGGETKSNTEKRREREEKEKPLCADEPARQNKLGSAENKKLLSAYFEKFYQAYPRKQSKKDAEKAFMKLKPDLELLEKILGSLEKQKCVEWQNKEMKHIPLPATWLNGERWNDELTVTTATPPPPRKQSNDELEERLKMAGL